MKERPILFGAPMVRAILDGRKTQTRRVALADTPVGYDDAADQAQSFLDFVGEDPRSLDPTRLHAKYDLWRSRWQEGVRP